MLIGWRPKSRDPNVASVRFRCLAPLTELQRQHFPIELYAEENADQYDLAIFSKSYGRADQELARAISARGGKTVLDLSDNHFYNPRELPEYAKAGADLRSMASCVDQVICCSAHLAHALSREIALSRPALVVGDAVEEFDFPVKAPLPFSPSEGGPFRILWFGSHGSPNAPSGMEDLLKVRQHLEAAERERATELVVVSNNSAKFDELKRHLTGPSRYVEWDSESFVRELARANLVIIPVSINPFTKCKSNNRLATALWYGVPAIADRIPAYDELSPFAFLGDWETGMRHCLAASREAQLRTAAGSAYVRRKFSIAEIAMQWRRALTEVVNRK